MKVIMNLKINIGLHINFFTLIKSIERKIFRLEYFINLNLFFRNQPFCRAGTFNFKLRCELISSGRNQNLLKLIRANSCLMT